MCISRKERKEMFYLTTHSTHFIYGYMASECAFQMKEIGLNFGRSDKRELRNDFGILVGPCWW